MQLEAPWSPDLPEGLPHHCNECPEEIPDEAWTWERVEYDRRDVDIVFYAECPACGAPQTVII